MSGTPLIQFLERFLNVAADRQSLVVHNMANIDTPNFKAQDVDFRGELQRAASGLDQAGMTPVVRKVSGLMERPDGNNVSLDRESMMLAETQLQFRMGIQFIRSEFHRLITAINEGKQS